MDIRQEAARGLTDIESFLYRQAHLRSARQRVLHFTAREPGLTAEQKTDIERWYIEEQIYVARMVTKHIADRISAAEERHHLRRGHWLRGALSVVVLTLVAAVPVMAILSVHG